MKRAELLKSREYWITKIQLQLFNLIEDYRIKKGYTKTQLAEELGFTKGYITQVLNGDFDHKVSKLVDLALAFGKVPQIKYVGIEQILERDEVSEDATSSQKIKQVDKKKPSFIGRNRSTLDIVGERKTKKLTPKKRKNISRKSDQ